MAPAGRLFLAPGRDMPIERAAQPHLSERVRLSVVGPLPRFFQGLPVIMVLPVSNLPAWRPARHRERCRSPGPGAFEMVLKQTPALRR
jgi:hypothetical protein